MSFVLIGRIHVEETTRFNSWKFLSKRLGRKVYVLESTKGFVEIHKKESVVEVKQIIKTYNVKYNTDFSVEGVR